MEVLRFVLLLLLCGTIDCSISSQPGKIKTLSKTDVREINRIVAENMEQEMQKTSSDEKGPEISVESTTTPFVEPTPPSPSTESTTLAADEIESIRHNISDSRAFECNITAQYLWDLCRPVLLRTCKDQYRTSCRFRPQRNRIQSFTRRLDRMFPRSRPPKIPNVRPKPLLKWLEDQISEVNDDDENFQFSISITTNNVSQVFTNEDLAAGVLNTTEGIRALERLLRRYRSRSPKFFRPDQHHGPRNWWFPDWGHGGDDDEYNDHGEDDGDDDHDSRTIEVPAGRVRPAIEETQKTIRNNPSYISPKRLPKLKKPSRRSRSKRHGRHRTLSSSAYARRGRVGPRMQWMNQRPSTNRFHAFGHHRPRWQWHHSSPNTFFRPEFHKSLNPPHRGMRRFPPMPPMNHALRLPSWMRGWDGDRDEEDEDDGTEGGEETFTCEEIEENPEICLEIAERTEKCENELKQVCPEYVAARTRIKEQLDNIFSRQYHFTEEEEESKPNYRTNEQYQWSAQFNGGKRPIVIESIKISRQGKGDAFVTAKLFDEVPVDFRVPFSDFRHPDNQSLGTAISKLAFQAYDSFVREHSRDA